ncbi:MAG: glucosaminidase domain-containing protein [Desulfobulbaceae bacterium]|nr:glucosaminidase domain-containing protein [Desulfobulbaceae bacterium]HIJ89955.1 glucosaminidase [Deltaproteobacteria bacterium]
MNRLASNRPPDVTQEQEKVVVVKHKVVSVKHDETPIYFGRQPIDSGMVRMISGLSLVILFFFLTILIQPSSVFIRFPQRFNSVPTIEANSAEDLLRQLKANNLWEVQAFSEVPAVLVSKFPGDLPSLDAPTQKKAFLHVLLPAAMIALSEVEAERAAFERIMAKFAQPPRFLNTEDFGRFVGLSQNEVLFLQNLCRKYRATEVADLRRRINPVPVSLIMAQGALESAWGGSRFALEGNNLFGIWTWDKVGLVPSDRDEGKSHSVAAYASLLESVRAYILMINRVPAYNELREIREATMDSLVLANGLLQYSERGSEYVADLSQLIRSNDLQIYDQCFLAGKGGLRDRVRFASLTNIQ